MSNLSVRDRVRNAIEQAKLKKKFPSRFPEGMAGSLLDGNIRQFEGSGPFTDVPTPLVDGPTSVQSLMAQDQAMGAMQDSMSFLSENKDAFSSLARGAMEVAVPGGNLASKIFSGAKDTISINKEVADQLGKGQTMDEWMKDMTPGKFTALSAFSTGLQTLGGLENISSQEKATLSRMQQQYDINVDEIEYQEWMGENVRAIAETERIVAEVKAMNAQAAGPLQQQQFIRDPSTGVVL